MSKSEVLKGLEGVITSYRRGKHLQHPNQVLLAFDDITNRIEAAPLVGRKVKWISETGKEFLGKVLAVHGNSGSVRATIPSAWTPCFPRSCNATTLPAPSCPRASEKYNESISPVLRGS